MKVLKKLVTCLTKLDKVANILVEVQRGLIVCQSCLESVKTVLKKNTATVKKIEKLLSYVNTATDAIGTVLEWFGRDGEVCMVAPRGLADEELVDVTNNIRGLLEQ